MDEVEDKGAGLGERGVDSRTGLSEGEDRGDRSPVGKVWECRGEDRTLGSAGLSGRPSDASRAEDGGAAGRCLAPESWQLAYGRGERSYEGQATADSPPRAIGSGMESLPIPESRERSLGFQRGSRAQDEAGGEGPEPGGLLSGPAAGEGSGPAPGVLSGATAEEPLPPELGLADGASVFLPASSSSHPPSIGACPAAKNPSVGHTEAGSLRPSACECPSPQDPQPGQAASNRQCSPVPISFAALTDVSGSVGDADHVSGPRSERAASEEPQPPASNSADGLCIAVPVDLGGLRGSSEAATPTDASWAPAVVPPADEHTAEGLLGDADGDGDPPGRPTTADLSSETCSSVAPDAPADDPPTRTGCSEGVAISAGSPSAENAVPGRSAGEALPPTSDMTGRILLLIPGGDGSQHHGPRPGSARTLGWGESPTLHRREPYEESDTMAEMLAGSHLCSASPPATVSAEGAKVPMEDADLALDLESTTATGITHDKPPGQSGSFAGKPAEESGSAAASGRGGLMGCLSGVASADMPGPPDAIPPTDRPTGAALVQDATSEEDRLAPAEICSGSDGSAGLASPAMMGSLEALAASVGSSPAEDSLPGRASAEAAASPLPRVPDAETAMSAPDGDSARSTSNGAHPEAESRGPGEFAIQRWVRCEGSDARSLQTEPLESSHACFASAAAPAVHEDDEGLHMERMRLGSDSQPREAPGRQLREDMGRSASEPSAPSHRSGAQGSSTVADSVGGSGPSHGAAPASRLAAPGLGGDPSILEGTGGTPPPPSGLCLGAGSVGRDEAAQFDVGLSSGLAASACSACAKGGFPGGRVESPSPPATAAIDGPALHAPQDGTGDRSLWAEPAAEMRGSEEGEGVAPRNREPCASAERTSSVPGATAASCRPGAPERNGLKASGDVRRCSTGGADSVGGSGVQELLQEGPRLPRGGPAAKPVEEDRAAVPAKRLRYGSEGSSLGSAESAAASVDGSCRRFGSPPLGSGAGASSELWRTEWEAEMPVHLSSLCAGLPAASRDSLPRESRHPSIVVSEAGSRSPESAGLFDPEGSSERRPRTPTDRAMHRGSREVRSAAGSSRDPRFDEPCAAEPEASRWDSDLGELLAADAADREFEDDSVVAVLRQHAERCLRELRSLGGAP
mmetsp:Transcript_25078/g.59732  ORF Transcript_25078/g.59732 Transcript_25078/m.59732 type:complete len:1147 (-) Transcript_25078:383-3823(-)